MQRHRKQGLKKEHTIIEGARGLLEDLTHCPYIKSVIPGRIYNASVRVRQVHLSFQYFKQTGFKLLVRTPTGIQEVFVVTSKAEKAEKWLQHKGLIGAGPQAAANQRNGKKNHRQASGAERKPPHKPAASPRFVDEYLEKQNRKNGFGVRVDGTAMMALESLKSELVKEDQKPSQRSQRNNGSNHKTPEISDMNEWVKYIDSQGDRVWKKLLDEFK